MLENSVILVLCVLSLVLVVEISGHGYMIDPPNRASLWRLNASFPTNYQDNQYFCGGFGVQYYENDGNCGECGDNYVDPKPRSNENGGIYGNGAILRTYSSGSIIDVNITITANHLGYFQYSLCIITEDKEEQPEEEECFQDLFLPDGSPHHPITAQDYKISHKLKLPDGITCEHCVLRWHWHTGNSWGTCDDGTQAMGCGIQEIFRSCADIRII